MFVLGTGNPLFIFLFFLHSHFFFFVNPTRQWLFEFADCVDPLRPTEGKPKAQAAADSIMRIVPNMKVSRPPLSHSLAMCV